jgi:hypothetical protein
MTKNRPRLAAVLIPFALMASGCGGGGEATVDQASSTNEDTASSAAEPAAEEEEPAAEAKGGEIVKTGFGQQDDYVWVTSLVKNLGDEAGATVTVQYNVKDAAGKILVSDSQVESFSRGGQLLVVGTQLSLPEGSKAATVDAALVVEPDGIGEEFPEMKIGPVTVGKGEYGGFTATFEITNTTAEPVSSLRVGVICFDAAGKVIGGTSEFPDLPPSGPARVDADVTVSGAPAKCEAYAGGV